MFICTILSLLLTPYDELEKVSKELGELPVNATQEKRFELLHRASSTVERGDVSTVTSFAGLLKQHLAKCSVDQQSSLIMEFDRVAESMREKDMSLADRASLCETRAKFYQTGLKKSRREVYWLVKEGECRMKIDELPNEDKSNRSRLVETLLNISDLHAAMGESENALRVHKQCRKFVDLDDANEVSFTYLARGATLAFRLGKHADAIQAYKVLLSRYHLAAHDRARMHANLAETLRLNKNLGESETELMKAQRLLSLLSRSNRQAMQIRIARISWKIFGDDLRFAEAIKACDTELGLVTSEPNYPSKVIRQLRRMRAYFLMRLERDTESLHEILSAESELVDIESKSFEHRVELVKLRIELSRIARQVGLYRLSRSKSLETLAELRGFPAGVQDDRLPQLVLTNLVGLPSIPFEERQLYQLEAQELRLKCYNDKVLARSVNMVEAAKLAEQQGRTTDARDIWGNLAAGLRGKSAEEMTLLEKSMLELCAMGLGGELSSSGLSKKTVADVRRSLEGSHIWRPSYALELFDSGDESGARKIALSALSEQRRSMQMITRKMSTNTPHVSASDAAVVIFVDDRTMDDQVAGSLWGKASLSSIRLLAKAKTGSLATNQPNDTNTNKSASIENEIKRCLLPAIRAKLLPTDVLVHYDTYVPQDDVRRLCQFVITRDTVKRHELGRFWGVMLDSRALGTCLKTGQSDLDAAKRLGARLGLANLQLNHRKRLLISNSASIVATPFAALVDSDGKRIVEKVAVVHVSAIASLVNSRALPESPERVMLVGDIDYAATKGDSPFRDQWPALPGTKTEIDDVRASAGQRPVVEYRARAATKNQIVETAKQCRTIHFATHASVIAKDFSPFDSPPDPLRLTGIVLSAANEKGPAAILTGLEICRLDLSKANLVVLADCETSQGSQYADSSIASLRQAFLVAGARNVVSSLWRVEDTSTAAFMKLLYHFMWDGKLKPEAAFRKAQLTLLKNPQLIPTLAKERGPDFKKVLMRPANPKPTPRTETHTRLWAAFQFSGAVAP